MAKNRRSSLQNTEVCTFFMHASERKIFRIQEKEKMVEKFYHVPKASILIISRCWSSIVSEEESPPYVKRRCVAWCVRPGKPSDLKRWSCVPGIGITYANRILEARRYATVTHELLKKMRISLKRCACFITCDGKYRGGSMLDSSDLWRLPADGAAQPERIDDIENGHFSG